MRKKTIVIATHNQDKYNEMKNILESIGLSMKSLKDFPDIGEIPETGVTLEENALIKARTVFQLTGLPALSDDTGLEVDALDREPGVYSARWAGDNCTYSDNVNKMIHKIKPLNIDDRTAQFRTVMALVDEKREHIAEGVIKGCIIEEVKGVDGFGYDPVFYIPDMKKTYAEMNMNEKNQISHRGKAVKNMQTFLQSHLPKIFQQMEDIA